MKFERRGDAVRWTQEDSYNVTRTGPSKQAAYARLCRRKELHDDGAVHSFGRGADLRHFGQGIQR